MIARRFRKFCNCGATTEKAQLGWGPQYPDRKLFGGHVSVMSGAKRLKRCTESHVPWAQPNIQSSSTQRPLVSCQAKWELLAAWKEAKALGRVALGLCKSCGKKGGKQLFFPKLNCFSATGCDTKRPSAAQWAALSFRLHCLTGNHATPPQNLSSVPRTPAEEGAGGHTRSSRTTEKFLCLGLVVLQSQNHWRKINIWTSCLLTTLLHEGPARGIRSEKTS